MVALFPASIFMHIPDGFLTLFVAAVTWLIMLGILAFALRQAQHQLDERLIPLAGIMGAFIFAAQMINFPVAGGTSGHFIGAALAFIVLGPWLGLLTMTAVIALQALLFQDGGLLVMGANILVMGVVSGFIGYQIYKLGRGRRSAVQTGISGLAAWLAVMFAALATTLLLAFSGTTSLAIALPAMLGVHALIGIGEALITVAALALIGRIRPTLLQNNQEKGQGSWLIIGLICVLLLVLLAPFASGKPDGLEWVAAVSGFDNLAQETPYQILPDYSIPYLGETALSTILAGFIGVIIVATIIISVGKTLGRKGEVQGGRVASGEWQSGKYDGG